MAGTSIMVGICTSSYPFPYPIEKVEDFPYSYPIEKVGDSPYQYSYPVNAEISRQNGNKFGQYPQEQGYLPSLFLNTFNIVNNFLITNKSYRYYDKRIIQ